MSRLQESGRFVGQCPHGALADAARQLLVACCLVFACLVFASGPVFAGGGPENVALVVNADSWASQTVANHYLQWRQIPPSNVVYLTDLSSFEQTDVETFRETILVPVFKTLFERNLLEHVDYIVYSSDFPTAIDARRDLGGAAPDKLLAPTASLTGLTYLYQFVLAKNRHYLELINNFYARRPLRDLQQSALSAEHGKAVQEAQELANAGKSQEPLEIQPTTAFRSKYAWDPTGTRVAEQGMRYVLSTMLAVTSGRGNSVREALDYLQRSVAADATHPRGTIYFMKNNDVRSTTRQWAFATAVQALTETGVQGAIVDGTLPQQKDDVLGAMIGSAGVNWKKSGSTILPGAICEHLTSFGGILTEGASQTPLTEFLRHGAAGSSGTVVEPLSIHAKFPSAFLHLHYVRGASLAEAFYQSVLGPYQLLIVGDALCQPWATRLELELPGVEPGQKTTGQLVLEPRVTGVSDISAAVDHFQVFLDGRRLASDPARQRFVLDTTAVADGWHELRVVAVAPGPLETQSRIMVPIVIANQGSSLTLERDGSDATEIAYGELLTVRARAADAPSIEILHNGRSLGTIEGSEGTLQVDTRRLGMGPVALQASSRLAGQTCRSAPLALTILPPPPLPPVTDVNAAQLVDGLRLTVGNDLPVIVTETKDARWLAKLNPGADQPLVLDAYFTVPADDVYQFQLEGNSVNALKVDDQQIWPTGTAPTGPIAWTMVPVHLQPGIHRFTLTGTTARAPTLRVRFGGPGCTSLDGKRFRHLE